MIALAKRAIGPGRLRLREMAEIGARADDQHQALLSGDDQWGMFGIKPAVEPLVESLPKPGRSARQSLTAGVAVVTGLIVFAVIATVNARSADQTSRAVSAQTVTVTRPASRPIPRPMNPPPALDIPLPFFPVFPAPPSAPAIASAQPSVSPVRIGQQIADGDFTFAVTSVIRSKTVANPNVPFLQTMAEGTFLTVALTITNNGKQPEVFIASYQKLRINGVVYAVDPVAALWTLTLETIVSPGGTATVPLPFDVPTGVPSGGALELHASANSRGVVELLPPQ